jgi:hypothetical protein
MRPGAQIPPGAAGSILAVLAIAGLGLSAGCAAIYIVTMPAGAIGLIADAADPAASAASASARETAKRARAAVREATP